MPVTNDFFMNVKRIRLAHEYILDRKRKCSYPHGRGYYGLIYVVSGRAEYRFDTGERITVGDGDVLFLSPNATYSIVTEKEFKHYTVNFDINEDFSRLDIFDALYRILKKGDPKQLELKFKKIVGIWTMKKMNFEMESVGCLYELLSLFYFEYTNRLHPDTYRRLRPAKEYIEQHFAQSVTLEYLAKLSYMSVTNFRREWKKIYLETPLQYRDSIRLYYAKEYLNSGYYTVSEIATKCGFDDASYFVRFFKKQTGITPREFKNKF